MKLTKKDFFDGQEMTEREKRINDQWQTDYNEQGLAKCRTSRHFSSAHN